jgi:hypothetical protein
MDKVDDAAHRGQKPWKTLRVSALRSPLLHTSPILTTAISNEVGLSLVLKQNASLSKFKSNFRGVAC